MAASTSGVELIAVSMDGEICRVYQGLSGTFAGLAYCCVDKRMLPGFFEKDLVAEAALKDRKLSLSLTGKRSDTELLEILETALLNMVAFPLPGSKADFFIEAKSNK
jgi:hypothetical protein